VTEMHASKYQLPAETMGTALHGIVEPPLQVLGHELATPVDDIYCALGPKEPWPASQLLLTVSCRRGSFGATTFAQGPFRTGRPPSNHSFGLEIVA